jgi:hypothetical protein
MRSMLMQSPTHAFVMKPGLPPFRDGWQDYGNTYTWVRDQVVLPQREFLDRISLEVGECEWLCEQLAVRLPFLGEVEFSSHRMGVSEFRNELVARLTKKEPHFGEIVEEEVDSLLFRSLPLCRLDQLEGRLREIFTLLLGEGKVGEVVEMVDRWMPSQTGLGYLSAQAVQECAHLIWMASTGFPTAKQDVAFAVRRAMRHLHYAYPAPHLFADSNWTHDYFAFVVNPGSRELDLWRVDHLGIEGSPMVSWRGWFDGSRQGEWIAYTHPQEYGQ